MIIIIMKILLDVQKAIWRCDYIESHIHRLCKKRGGNNKCCYEIQRNDDM